MALEYFLYNTNYGNTIVNRGNISFSPVPPYEEIYIESLIPETQPLYLYANSGGTGGTIIVNSQENIDAYLEGTAPPSQPQDPVFQETFTGYTANTLSNINTRVYRSGDTMTGTLCSTSNLLASGVVTGSSVSASVLMTTPVLNASTSVCAPRISGSTCITSPITCGTTLVQSPVLCGSTCAIAPITIGSTCVCSPRIVGSISAVAPIVSGSTCVTSPISCATTRMQSPIVCGGTCVTSPISCATTRMQAPIITGSTSVMSPTICAASCLCSLGTTRLVGATTAASTLNVSGATIIGSTLSTTGTISESGVLLTTKYLQVSNFNTYSGTTLTNINSRIPKVLSGVTSGHLALMNADGTIRDGDVSISQLTGGTGYYVYGEKEVPESTTSVTGVTYLTTGATLTEGIFSLDYIGVVGNSVKLKPAYIQFYLDNSPISTAFAFIPAENNGFGPQSFMRDRYLSGGTHTFSIRYFAGVNTALMNSAAIRVRKVN